MTTSTLYGTCITCEREPATQAVVFDDEQFAAANDRGGANRMTVALGDIVFCDVCAIVAAAIADALPVNANSRICDVCDGPAHFSVSGNTRGIRCLGHVQQFIRGRTAQFYLVKLLPLTD